MTTQPPPDPYFLGINFNPSFYDESDTITQNESDARYLQKTITDTTTSLQNFLGGINCASSTISVSQIITGDILSDGPTQDLTIGNLQTGGGLDLGCGFTRTGNVNIATTKNTSSVQSINLGSSNILATGQIIQINRPLTIGYTINPTGLNKIGGSSFATSPTAVSILAAAVTLISIVNIPIGVYQVYYQIFHTILTSPVIFTSENVLMCDTANSISAVLDRIETLHNVSVGVSRPVGYYTIAGCGILINNVASQTVYLNVKYTFSGGTLIGIGHIRLVRIG